MRRLLRVTRRLIILIAVAFLGWTLVFNLLLNTSALTALLNRSQDDVHLRHGVAWSLWPTRLFVHDLEIHGQDSAVEWMIALDRAEAGIDLRALSEKRLVLSNARARGVAFRLRKTRPLEELCKIPTLPELPRLANPKSTREACLAQSDTSKKRGAPPRPENLWQVDLSKISAHDVREVWVEEEHFTGRAELDGKFYFWPTVRIALPELKFDIAEGALTSRKASVLDAISARGEAVLLAADLAEGSAPLVDRLSVAADVKLEVASVGFLNDRFRGPAGLNFDRGSVLIDGTLKMIGGVIKPGTSIEAKARDVRARMLDHVALGSGRVWWRMGEESRGRLEATLDEFRLQFVDDAGAPILGEGCSLVLSTQGASLSEPFQITSARFELARATVPELARFNRYLPASERIEIIGGSAELSGAFSVGADESTETAKVRLAFDGVRVGWKQFELHGAGEVEALGRLDPPRLTLKKVGFDLRDGSISAGGDRLTSGIRIFGAASLGSIAFHRLEEQLLEKLNLDAGLVADVRDLRAINKHFMNTPWLAFDRGRGRVEGRVRLASGRLQPGTKIKARSNELVAQIFDHRARGKGQVSWELGEEQGKLIAALDEFELHRIGFQQTHVRGEQLSIALDTSGREINRPFEVTRAKLSIERATIPDLTFYNTYLPPSLELLIAAGSATVSAELVAQSKNTAEAGRVSLRADSVLLHWRDYDVRGAVSLDGTVQSVDLARGTFAIGGTRVRLDRVQVQDPDEAEPAIRDWWGELALDEATFRLDPLQIEGAVSTHLRDVRPLLTIYGAEAGIPKWTHGLLAADDTRGACRVRFGHQQLIVQGVDLFGGGLRARAHAKFDESGAYASALLGFGAFAVGAALENGETHFDILNATQKFQESEQKFRETIEVVN